MSVLRDYLEPIQKLCEQYLGIQIDPRWVEMITVVSFLIFALLTLQNTYLWMRRRVLGDMAALPEEQLAVVNLIAKDVKSLKVHVEQVMSGLDTSISGRLEEALEKIRAYENDNPKIDDKPDAAAGSRAARLFIATQVKEAVIAKFLEGGWFREGGQRHVFDLDTETTEGERILIQLQTPYREWNRDDHFDYVLEIWLGSGLTKVLNFEWSAEEDPWLRFLKASGWVDQVARWSLKRPSEKRVIIQAAQ